MITSEQLAAPQPRNGVFPSVPVGTNFVLGQAALNPFTQTQRKTYRENLHWLEAQAETEQNAAQNLRRLRLAQTGLSGLGQDVTLKAMRKKYSKLRLGSGLAGLGRSKAQKAAARAAWLLETETELDENLQTGLNNIGTGRPAISVKNLVKEAAPTPSIVPGYTPGTDIIPSYIPGVTPAAVTPAPAAAPQIQQYVRYIPYAAAGVGLFMLLNTLLKAK